MSLSDKPFDIVVFGASGYTGRLLLNISQPNMPDQT